MDEHVEELEHAGCTIRVFQDCDPCNPRKEFDNAGRLVSFDRNLESDDGGHVEEYHRDECAADWTEDGSVVEWCRFEDYGSRGARFHAGYDAEDANAALVCDAATVEAEWSGDRVKARKYLEGEAATFDAYVSGEVYGYVVEGSDGINGASVWGYYAPYGSSEWDYMLGEARSDAETVAEAVAAEKAERAHWAARDTLTV